MASCSGDQKKEQDRRFDSHLTGVKKESFIGLRKQQLITKGFRESENKCGILKKFTRSKLRAL